MHAWEALEYICKKISKKCNIHKQPKLSLFKTETKAGVSAIVCRASDICSF